MSLSEEVSVLAGIMNEYGLTRIEASDGKTRVLLEKNMTGHSCLGNPKSRKSVNITSAKVETVKKDAETNELLYEVKSPIVGVYYAAPSPDAMPFVTIGQNVEKGDCLCIIEAMKQMNEIYSEQRGVIADICIRNGDLAEFGQVLFKIRVSTP